MIREPWISIVLVLSGVAATIYLAEKTLPVLNVVAPSVARNLARFIRYLRSRIGLLKPTRLALNAFMVSLPFSVLGVPLATWFFMDKLGIIEVAAYLVAGTTFIFFIWMYGRVLRSVNDI